MLLVTVASQFERLRLRDGPRPGSAVTSDSELSDSESDTVTPYRHGDATGKFTRKDPPGLD